MTIVVVTPPATEPLTIAEVMTHCRIDESNQEPAPGVITVALVTAAGNVDAGSHRYLATFVTPDGETQAGTVSAAVTNDLAHGKSALSGIPIGGALVTARKLYRTEAGGSTFLLMATIADNTTTTYTDDIADANLGAEAPSVNTTADPLLSMLIASTRQAAELELHRYLITQTLDAYFDSFPDEFRLPPLQSVTSITYIDANGDTQTLETSQYVVDANSQPARISPAYGVSWPSTRCQRNAVTVRFVAGYGAAGAVPDCIKHWMLLRIKHAYDQRNPVNVGNIVTAFPRDYINGLLDPERIYGGLHE